MRKGVIAGVLCLLMMGVLLLMGLFTFPYKQLIYSVVSAVMFLLSGWFLKALSPEMGFRRFFALRRPKFRNFFIVLWFACLLILGSFMLNFLTSYVCDRLGIEAASQSIGAFDGENKILSLIFLAVAPAVFEELFFRGAVCSFLAEKGVTFSVFVSSALFVLMHGPDVYFLSTFFAGIMFAYVVYFTGSVYSSMIIHFVNNVMSYILILYAERLAAVKLDLYMLYGAGLFFILSVILVLTSVMHKFDKKSGKIKTGAEESVKWEEKKENTQKD